MIDAQQQRASFQAGSESPTSAYKRFVVENNELEQKIRKYRELESRISKLDQVKVARLQQLSADLAFHQRMAAVCKNDVKKKHHQSNPAEQQTPLTISSVTATPMVISRAQEIPETPSLDSPSFKNTDTLLSSKQSMLSFSIDDSA